MFARYYNPERHLSIDEMMIGTRCRIAFLQYLPNKPTKFGIKVWVIAEAKTGYVLGFQIYTGASQDDQSKGLAYRVVMDLIEPFVGKEHSLYIDKFLYIFFRKKCMRLVRCVSTSWYVEG